MKHVITVIAVALALPLSAQEKTDTTTTANASAAASAQPAAQPDSPLVAAAKRANRLGKKPKSEVITNFSIKSTNGTAHMTTSSAPSAMNAPTPMEAPHPTPEMVAADEAAKTRKKAQEAAAVQRAAAEEKQRKIEAEATAAEEGYDGAQDDAGEFVGTQPPPPSR